MFYSFLDVFFYVPLEKKEKTGQEQQSYTLYFPFDHFFVCLFKYFVLSPTFRKSGSVIEKYYFT